MRGGEPAVEGGEQCPYHGRGLRGGQVVGPQVHPVLGHQQGHSGEVVRVAIVKRDPALTAEQVIAYCRENLTGYTVPKIVEFWKELPKTNVGKVLRREVKSAPVRA